MLSPDWKVMAFKLFVLHKALNSRQLMKVTNNEIFGVNVFLGSYFTPWKQHEHSKLWISA